MAQARLKIFVSAVTSEFGKARDELAADLRARGLSNENDSLPFLG
jgi:hypothetical protein